MENSFTLGLWLLFWARGLVRIRTLDFTGLSNFTVFVLLFLFLLCLVVVAVFIS